MRVEHVRGETFHGRKGALENSFRYGVDYVILDPEAVEAPALFSRNRGNLVALHDRDYGGEPGRGRGVAWVREVLAAHAAPGEERILLLTQPRVLGHVFNPVSFWLCHDAAGALRTVVAEVSNTFGDRHWYLCTKPDGSPITRSDTLTATKIMHVSPFQPVEGSYRFRFDIRDDRVGIWIDYSFGEGGLFATLTGTRAPLTNAGILAACMRRPFGSRRVLALIHWQALKLALKGARYRTRPAPPAQDVSR
ncbi:DUF1365 domain-containing protein [Cereibacter sphaeroides]|uniref:DUF1365 domain-containing protein n=1 Tax=Cereibacter sphaeroides TaxID=1063 RepID=UPI001F1E9638|nr:DUF1365 domain-containing protein [Cereibacter sphaeroides]MCE6958606.1 DUF1365 domain-containing protein [Cereibacter sphaeroides]MCE6968961.1 DUF1365 domain-containing protein [Cereibacter sphaeroides]MCE6972351.1 DUF1365 domain-containing protein [Cereibacter sphaeroides]